MDSSKWFDEQISVDQTCVYAKEREAGWRVDVGNYLVGRVPDCQALPASIENNETQGTPITYVMLRQAEAQTMTDTHFITLSNCTLACLSDNLNGKAKELCLNGSRLN